MTEEEVWRDVPMPRYAKSYAVSNLGRVMSKARASVCMGIRRTLPEQLIKPHRQNKGYYYVCLYHMGQRRQVHVARLVLLAFAGPPPEPGMEANHENRDKSDNRLSNLSWMTRPDNVKHALAVPAPDDFLREEDW